VGLVDGPVAKELPHLNGANIVAAPGFSMAECNPKSAAWQHGTFIASILSAHRSSPAPAICPDCTLFVRPVFWDDQPTPRATPEELAAAIMEGVGSGVRVLNLSVALTGRSRDGGRQIHDALDHAMQNGTIVVAAAGNQSRVGGSTITAHPWVIPVVSYGFDGRPLDVSDLGASIGAGVGAPGEHVVGLAPDGSRLELSGTSVAAPFVSGAIALLWSQVPSASAAEVRYAITQQTRRRSIVPALLDAAMAHTRLQELSRRR
ncbi:MAG TPA: S8 family serine peptidase, partial [Mycobacterium sp.]|nr:S8 family serine peptidase [Mycobacterium sp.]